LNLVENILDFRIQTGKYIILVYSQGFAFVKSKSDIPTIYCPT